MGSRTLTQHAIDKLKPRDKAYEVYDLRDPALMVRVYPSGKKTYCVRYAPDKRFTDTPKFAYFCKTSQSSCATTNLTKHSQ